MVIESDSYIEQAKQILESLRKTDKTAKRLMRTRTEYGENYLNEAKRLLKRFKKKSRFVNSTKNHVQSKAESSFATLEKSTLNNDTKQIKKILNDNVQTKEGLRAIIAEIIRRRLNVLKSSQ